MVGHVRVNEPIVNRRTEASSRPQRREKLRKRPPFDPRIADPAHHVLRCLAGGIFHGRASTAHGRVESTCQVRHAVNDVSIPLKSQEAAHATRIKQKSLQFGLSLPHAHHSLSTQAPNWPHISLGLFSGTLVRSPGGWCVTSSRGERIIE